MLHLVIEWVWSAGSDSRGSPEVGCHHLGWDFKHVQDCTGADSRAA